MEITKLLSDLYHEFGDKYFIATDTIDILGNNYRSYISIYVSTGMINRNGDTYKLTDEAIELIKKA